MDGGDIEEEEDDLEDESEEELGPGKLQFSLLVANMHRL